MSDKLFVNGKEIFLGNKSLSLNILGFDLSDFTKQGKAFSQKIKIPLTEENLKALSFPQEIGEGSRTCYKLNPCSLWIDGFNVLPSGVLKIEKVSDYIEAVVFSKEASFFRQIKGLNLSDLEAYNKGHFWDMSTVEAKANATFFQSDVFYPLINYSNNPVSGNLFNYKYLLPAFWVVDVLKEIFQAQDYTISIFEVLDFPLFFTQCLIPFSKKSFENGSEYVEKHSFNAVSQAQTVVSENYENLSGSFETPDLITKIAVLDSQNPNFSSSEFTEPNSSKITVIGEFEISNFVFSSTPFPPPPSLLAFYRIAIVKNGVVSNSVLIGTNLSTPGGKYSIEAEIDLTQNDELYLAFVVSVESQDLGDEITVSGVINNASFYTQSVQKKISPGGWVVEKDQLPPLKQADFVKGILNLFRAFLIIDDVSGFWDLRFFEEISRNNPLKWDGKLLKAPNQKNWYVEKETSVKTLFQRTEFNYKEEDSEEEAIDRGNGFFDIDNEGLEKTGELFSPIFAASNENLVTNDSGDSRVCAKIERFDSEGKETDLEARILKINPPGVFGAFQIKLTDSDSGGSVGGAYNIPVATFSEKNADSGGLAFESDLKERFYNSYIEAVNNFVEVTVYLELTPSDISQIIKQFSDISEQLRPIYLKGNYWLIKKIENYNSKNFTKVVLQKI
jgi:hypothetical protein